MRSIITVVVPFVLAATACSASSGGSNGGATGTTSNASTVTAESFCQAACDRINSCDTGKDVQTCTAQCENVNASVLPKMRKDIVDATTSCFAEKDCKTVLTSSFVKTCVSEAAASIAPSATAVQFCDSWASAMKKCGTSNPNKTECLNQAKLYGDEALTSATSCTSKSCSDMGPCIDAASGVTRSSSSSGSSGGSAPPAGSSSAG